jgi:hypothetical protein
MRAGAPTDQVVALHRWTEAGHRLVLVNFGEASTVRLTDVLAPGASLGDWRVTWHSNDVRYGGESAPPSLADGEVRLPASTAALLTSP